MLAQLTNAVFPGDDELEEGTSRRNQSTSALPCGGGEEQFVAQTLVFIYRTYVQLDLSCVTLR